MSTQPTETWTHKLVDRLVDKADAKDFIAYALTGGYLYCVFRGMIPTPFQTIFDIVIGFYFGSKIAGA